MLCEKCGMVNGEGVRFCTNCGNPVTEKKRNETEQQSQQTYPPQQYQAPVQQYQEQPQQFQEQPQQFQAQPQQYQSQVQQGGVQQGYQNYPNQPYGQGYSPYAPVKTKKRKGCLVVVIIVLLILAAAIVYIVLNGGEFNFSFTTAKITDLKTASEIDSVTGKAVTVTDKFAPSTPIIYVTGATNNAPEGTKIKAVWIHTDSNSQVEGPEIEISGSRYFFFQLEKGQNDFPTGNYEVKIFLDGKEVKSAKFKVE